MRIKNLLPAAATAAAISLTAVLGSAAPALALTPKPVITHLSSYGGYVSYSRTIKFTGTNLSALTGLYLGSSKLAQFTHVSDTEVTALVDHAPNFAPTTQQVYAVFSGGKIATGKTFHYGASSRVDREMEYLGANLHRRGNSTYPYYTSEDCANFTSQVLHARGLSTNSTWHSGSAAWISSTDLRAYLLSHKLVTEYTDTQANRAHVHVGDIMQADWNRSGDRDHTGIVTRITKDAKGHITIYYSAHTDPYNSPTQDETPEDSIKIHERVLHLSHPGAIYFLHLR